MEQMSIFDFPEYLPEKKSPKLVDIKGICDDGYCPECGACNFDLAEKCQYCGCLLDWTRWKEINEYEGENTNDKDEASHIL